MKEPESILNLSSLVIPNLLYLNLLAILIFLLKLWKTSIGQFHLFCNNVDLFVYF